MKSPEEKKKENQKFIQDKIDPIVNRLLLEMLNSKPHNVVE